MSHHHRRAAAVSAPDPYFSSTVLLLTGNGTNGGQNNTFLDDSSNSFTITRFGNTTQGSFSPFTGAGGSGYFDGAGDYLTAGGQTSYQFGTGDFTIEFWIYFTSVSGQSNIMDFRSSAGTPAIAPVIYRLSGVIRFFTNGSDRIVGTTSVTTGQWYHIAVARSGTSTKLFLNGNQEGSTYTDSNSYGIGTNAPSIGSSFTTNYTTGYISSLRLLKGTAQYTSNFTPPTTPLTAITNTQLLLNFTNGSIVDATGKNDLETVGNAQVSTTVKKYGTGSLLFDGVSDSLFMRYTTDFFLQTSYTIEAWIYPTTTSGYRPIFTIEPTSGSNFGALILAQNGTAINGECRPTTGGTNVVITGGTLTANQWFHVALSVSSGSAKLYLDGSQVGTTSTFTNFSFTPVGVAVGANANQFNFTTQVFLGNIADLRVTKGIARYTSNFTPPYRQLPTR